ncbi:MAG: IclR family transcriptional regulator [Thermoleophilia bacterium]
MTRALAVLDCLEEEGELTLAEIGARIGTQAANAHKLVLHLQEAGLVELNPLTRRYRLSVGRLAALASGALASRNPWEALRTSVPSLAASTGLPGLIAVLVGGRVVYVEQFRGAARALGRAFPAHATALGKAILAALPAGDRERLLPELALDAWTPKTITSRPRLEVELALTAERGWAIEDGELDLPRRSIGAPIRDRTGTVIAAIGIGGEASAIPDDRLDELGAAVVAEAARVSTDLGSSTDRPTPTRLDVELLGAVEPPPVLLDVETTPAPSGLTTEPRK